MKTIAKIVFSLLLLFIGSKLYAQCSCSNNVLYGVVRNGDYKIVSSYGSNTAVTSLSPGTYYYLRVDISYGACSQPGSGCSSISEPIASVIELVDGATVFGSNVPPEVGLDVGSSNSYTVYFQIRTWTGGDFLSQIYFKMNAECFPSSTCGILQGSGTTQYGILRPL